MRFQRVLHGTRHRRKRSLVQNKVNLVNGLLNLVHIAQIAFNQLDPIGDFLEILALAGREVVEHSHVVAAFQQITDEIGANEARAPRYEIKCHTILLFI
jgi:hypothetical protein